MFKKPPFQIVILLLIFFLAAPYLPLFFFQLLYSISLLIKDFLMSILPIIIAFFIAHAVTAFKRKAPLFILTLIIFEAISNFTSSWFGFFTAYLSSDFFPPLQMAADHSDFSPLWRLPWTSPSWWSADKGAIGGILLGFAAIFGQKLKLPTLINKGKSMAEVILTKLFARIIPLFVLGFTARMYQTGILKYAMGEYAPLLLCLALFLLIYISLLFWIGSGKNLLTAIKNMLPAGAVAFTSGCSISTIPWTIAGASKNMEDKELSKAIIPATINIQQIGDCITNTFLCFLIYLHFFGHPPPLLTWLAFTSVFVLARFATAAVLGGAIFIMLPIYETYLSFSPEMISIILAFNVILDPLVTSSNVIANGALCRVFEKVWRRLGKAPLKAEEL